MRKKTKPIQAVPDEGEKDAPAPRNGPLLVVRDGMVLFWPMHASGRPPIRGHAGTVVPADDPMLNTAVVAQDLKQRLGILDNADQRWKCDPAPRGARVSTHSALRAKDLYLELGYGGVPFAMPCDSNAEVAPSKPCPRAPNRATVLSTVPPIDGE